MFVLSLLCFSALFSQQTGDASRGAALFAGKGGCVTCHRVGDNGPRTGVELTDIGSLRGREAIEKAMLEPPKEVSAPNRLFRVVMNDGTTYTGRLLNQDTASIQMLDSTDQLRSLPRSSMRQQGFTETPPMPSFKDRLNAQELADIVAYLLKGVNAQ